VATPSADDLLAHTDWLMGLARALVGEANAEDIVQETFAVAVKRPPQGAVRPWLGGIARNLSKMTTRSRVRREARELAAPAAAEVPTPEALVARVQMQQRVARIVLELHEPLRATLLLRFFEGMDASEIARAQNIPASTVRSRIKDALDRVRATLDQEHAGDRKRWAVLLAPLPLAAPTKGAALLGGGLVMKKLIIVLVVLLAIVIGTRVAGVWGGKKETAKPAAVAKPVTPAKPVAPKPAAAPQAGGFELPLFHDDDPKGTLRLEGQVIDEHDAPVAKAMVAIDANPPIVVETEADGSFVFDKLIPRDYRLEATANDGYAGPARLRLTEKPEPVTLRLKRGGTVEVAVTDKANGAPIKAAAVELRSTLTWKATTNAEGVATLKGVGPVWAPLAVRADGFAPADVHVSASGNPDSAHRVAVALQHGAAISGRVVDEAGKPVAAARVYATSASEPFLVVDPRRDGVLSGTDGKFSLPAVAPGTWRLTASHGDFAPTTSDPINVDGKTPRAGIELALGAGAIVKGIVKDKAGKPVPSADVRVVAQGFIWWRSSRQAFTDADGKFAITGLARRTVDVIAQADTGSSAITPLDLAAKREHDVTLTLDTSGAITGTVVDNKGAPIGDAQVIAEPDFAAASTVDRIAWNVRGEQETVTDQAGKFHFPGLPDGTYQVRAARLGATEHALSLAPATTAKPNGAPLTITLAADGRVTGKLAFADGKVPASYNVMLGWTYPTPFASKDGSFTLSGPPGKHRLTITGIGFVEQKQEVTIDPGKDTDLGTITVAGGRSISGRVLDENHAPVAKAKVAAGMLLTGGGADLYIEEESIGAKSTETDENGQFVLEGFPPATLTIIAGKDNTGRSPSLRIPASSDSTSVDLVLAGTSGLDGKITRDGKPLGDTVIIANPIAARGSNFFVVTGADGTFALDALAPGAYIVYPMLGGGGNKPKDIYTKKVIVEMAKRAHVDIDTTAGPITLAVTVKTDKGNPVPMAGIATIGVALDVKSVEEFQDLSRVPYGPDQVIPVYMRPAIGGSVELTGLRPGVHTMCAVFGNPMVADPSTIKFKCTAPTKLTNPKHAVTITVPAAWFE
jgi:RNA polymerase sigma factor (sigma-70 family)